jgi:hypothetical protein
MIDGILGAAICANEDAKQLADERAEVARLESENARLREEYVNDFRMDELDALVHSVDKWFDDDDPRLERNPATRAGDAREIALKAIETLQARVARLLSALKKARQAMRERRDAIDWGSYAVMNHLSVITTMDAEDTAIDAILADSEKGR